MIKKTALLGSCTEIKNSAHQSDACRISFKLTEMHNHFPILMKKRMEIDLKFSASAICHACSKRTPFVLRLPCCMCPGAEHSLVGFNKSMSTQSSIETLEFVIKHLEVRFQ